jgi:hypothetical protein
VTEVSTQEEHQKSRKREESINSSGIPESGEKKMLSDRKVLHFFQRPGLSEGKLRDKLHSLKPICPDILSIDSEFCFNVEIAGKFILSDNLRNVNVMLFLSITQDKRLCKKNKKKG